MPRLVGKNKARKRKSKKLAGHHKNGYGSTPLRYEDGRPVLLHMISEQEGKYITYPIFDPRYKQFQHEDYETKLAYAELLLDAIERPIETKLLKVLYWVWLEIQRSYDGGEKDNIYLQLEKLFKTKSAA